MDTIIYMHNSIPTANVLVVNGNYAVAFFNSEFLFPISGKWYKGQDYFEYFSRIGLDWNGSNGLVMLEE